MNRRRGLTLIELMVTLTIGAMLMAAVAAAFSASSKAVALNDANFRCTQSARVAMGQILSELRRADAVKVDPGGLWVQVIRPEDQLTRDEIYRQYKYVADAHRITLQIFFAGNRSSPIYEVASGVEEARFSFAGAAEDAPEHAVSRVSIFITCSLNDSSVTIHGSAAPRRAQASAINP